MNEAPHPWGCTQERRTRQTAAIRRMPVPARRSNAKAADDLAGPVVALPSHHGDAGVLPTWQLAASSSVSTAPQPVAPEPTRLVLDDRTGPRDDDDDDDDDDDGDGDGDGDSDSDGAGNFVRERDAQGTTAYWHGDLGQLMRLPATPPSRQARARIAVQDALTNLARVSSKQPIRSP